ncbi:MAG: aspartate/glutamate racemase family protein [Thermodesulfobacteriota bacterium]
MKRLAVLHTVFFLADLFKKRIAERFPKLDCFHVLDESILPDLFQQGGLTPALVRRIVTQAVLARDAGAELILFTCSSTSPAVDTARALVDVPIIKIDDPMAARAVTLGERIGLLCTAATTQEPSTRLILEHAARLGRRVQVTSELESRAFQAVMSGDRPGHDRLVKAAARRLSERVEVVVLAQASMAHLAPELNESLPAPVLASPDLCLEALAAMLEE